MACRDEPLLSPSAFIALTIISMYLGCVAVLAVKKVSEFLQWRFNESEKICFSPEVPIQPCRPKSDSALPGVIWAQFKPNSPIKRLFQLTLGPISALGSKSALVNWTVLALIKGAELDSKIGLYQLLTHCPPSLGLKQILLIYTVYTVTKSQPISSV